MITPIYSPAPGRYENGMKYRRCGKSGILLPEISLGMAQLRRCQYLRQLAINGTLRIRQGYHPF